MSKAAKKENMPAFEALARELGCDPDDPRVAEVLKAMAGQQPQPHEKPKAERPRAGPKKPKTLRD